LLAARLLEPPLAGTVEKIPPLVFVFVITYYVERLAFFDVLIKKGTFVFASLLLLTLLFVFGAPILLHLQLKTWVGSLAWALLMWPVVLLAPWGHRKLSAWIDRVWLGRRFTAAEATRHFFEGLAGVIEEPELAERAARRLGEIFGSKAEVVFGDAQAVGEGAMSAPIRLAGQKVGEVRIALREESHQFLSEDVTLLSSLAGGLAYLVENLRLREKRLEHEKREQALILDANRSELKALRAQVNPHFLFNALNTIAGLIPRHPGRAEQTVEELAEVFRYTLHRSEREWVHLGEELEAVEAYLRIEQARFGERLRFEVVADPRARDLRIPAMMVQTLVENAVKHGIAARSEGGRVDVRAEVLADSRLRIEVRDSGPGFDDRATRDLPSSGGYGLRNVRDRLSGYFGREGQLMIGRDDRGGMTVVSVEMPCSQRAAAGKVS
jgi:signal transduction histidine kinase